jgi:hypothetical protein
MNVGGISFNIAFRAKWRPVAWVGALRTRTIRPQTPEGIAPKGGFRFDIVWGPIVRPIPKFWLPGFWLRRDQGYNPWHQGCYAFILRIPYSIGFFMSAGLGWGNRQPGFYFGLKSYKVDHGSSGLKNENGWFVIDLDTGTVPLTWPKKKDVGRIYLCPSMSIRSDLVE